MAVRNIIFCLYKRRYTPNFVETGYLHIARVVASTTSIALSVPSACYKSEIIKKFCMPQINCFDYSYIMII